MKINYLEEICKRGILLITLKHPHMLFEFSETFGLVIEQVFHLDFCDKLDGHLTFQFQITSHDKITNKIIKIVLMKLLRFSCLR